MSARRVRRGPELLTLAVHAIAGDELTAKYLSKGKLKSLPVLHHSTYLWKTHETDLSIKRSIQLLDAESKTSLI